MSDLVTVLSGLMLSCFFIYAAERIGDRLEQINESLDFFVKRVKDEDSER